MSSPSVADSVRLALGSEAGSIAALQRRYWEGQGEIGRVALDALDLATMTEAWTAAITRPPLAQHRVLVAVTSTDLVGFTTTAPSPDPDAEAGTDGELGDLVVDPRAVGAGHGSRLLNAAVDTLRADGFTRATCWVLSTDDAVRGFLVASGWAADGAHREVGTEDGSHRARQVRLHTDISEVAGDGVGEDVR